MALCRSTTSTVHEGRGRIAVIGITARHPCIMIQFLTLMCCCWFQQLSHDIGISLFQVEGRGRGSEPLYSRLPCWVLPYSQRANCPWPVAASRSVEPPCQRYLSVQPRLLTPQHQLAVVVPLARCHAAHLLRACAIECSARPRLRTRGGGRSTGGTGGRGGEGGRLRTICSAFAHFVWLCTRKRNGGLCSDVGWRDGAGTLSH